MERLERIVRLHSLLKSARYPLSLRSLMEELRCSRATLYRDIAFLRDVLRAPIENLTIDEAAHIRYGDEGAAYELPGLWLSPEELRALIVLERLLPRQESELIGSALEPLREAIGELLRKQAGGRELPYHRIRIVEIGQRRVDAQVFGVVANALLERKRLRFRYKARSTNQESERDVSPQRLVHYRDNWYLDAYDHDREALRSFSVDRIREPVPVAGESCRDIPDAELDEHYRSSYGIFAGPARERAVIRFSARAARWVAEERWHGQQEGRFLADGRYELSVPYGHPRELLMDVLRYGPEAEVVSPVSLREQAKALLEATLAGYERPPEA
ncbi:MAG: transcriptional regulator [Lysobacterales bacterium]|jgi:predicted DNA-binding transcriptional regulator YafY|nr:MAG: transcriptional regulator [Xanthomonadales bacterium]